MVMLWHSILKSKKALSRTTSCTSRISLCISA